MFFRREYIKEREIQNEFDSAFSWTAIITFNKGKELE